MNVIIHLFLASQATLEACSSTYLKRLLILSLYPLDIPLYIHIPPGGCLFWHTNTILSQRQQYHCMAVRSLNYLTMVQPTNCALKPRALIVCCVQETWRATPALLQQSRFGSAWRLLAGHWGSGMDTKHSSSVRACHCGIWLHRCAHCQLHCRQLIEPCRCYLKHRRQMKSSALWVTRTCDTLSLAQARSSRVLPWVHPCACSQNNDCASSSSSLKSECGLQLHTAGKKR